MSAKVSLVFGFAAVMMDANAANASSAKYRVMA